MAYFIDPSETRKGTKMPVDAQEIFIELPGLEERTGADFLLSSLQMPAANDALLRRHCEAGILVQRKSGLDLPSSIIDGRLSHSLGKMLEWCKRPWLLIVGNLTEQSGKVSVGGSPSNLTYGQVIAAVDWYQMRGGFVTILEDADKVYIWCLEQQERLIKVLGSPTKEIHERMPDQVLTWPPRPWVRTLRTLPGIDIKLGDLIAEQSGSLAAALINLTSHYWLTEAGARPHGIGEKTIRRVRNYMGMREEYIELKVDIAKQVLIAEGENDEN